MLEAFKETQAAFPWFFTGAFFVFGAVVGSFLNVCIFRIPKGESIVVPGSHCACGAPVPPHLNVPVLSWIFLRGRAACCGRKISLRYPATELLVACLFAAAWHFLPWELAVHAMIFFAFAVVLAFIDWDTMLLPDSVNAPFALAGLICGAAFPRALGATEPLAGFFLACVGLGVGSLAIFGSHLTRRRTLLPDTVHITALDTSVAFISGLIIFPACFAFGVEAGSGPGLIFLSLPNVFHAMPHGAFWGAVFFLFMSFAALSTVIAVFENILSFPMDLFGWSRRKSVFWNLPAMLVLTLPCIFGFNLWKAFTPFGPGSNILDLEDFLLSNTILPVGALVYLLFCATRYGWGFKNFRAEVNAGSGAKIPAWLGRYLMTVPPVIVFCLLIQSWIARFFAS